MKFTVIENKYDQRALDLCGYKFKAGSDRIINGELYERLLTERGERFVENEKDDFYDGCFNPICKGKDGKLYAVQFVYIDDTEEPLFWQEVEVIK